MRALRSDDAGAHQRGERRLFSALDEAVIVLFKLVRLTVNRVLDFHDDYGAISSDLIRMLFLKVQSQRGQVPIGSAAHDPTFH